MSAAAPQGGIHSAPEPVALVDHRPSSHNGIFVKDARAIANLPHGTPLFAAPPAPGDMAVSLRDAKDAERYRLMRRNVCIVGDQFHILNIRPTYVAPDAAAELDAVLDAAILATEGG